MTEELVYSVTDFVAICNQVLDVSFSAVQISGELANFKISKNRWIYFDLKDEHSSLRFFGTVYQLAGPLEDGMKLTVRGAPQLHPRFGFSIIVQSILLSGEGTIKKASQLLVKRLEKEGLFDQDRKRDLPYPPKVIGVISSAESAGYADFIKIINERWSGLIIRFLDVNVQGETAPKQIINAINYFNQHNYDVEALVIIRGGGSIDDLQTFSHEAVTRAVAGSRIPTVVAIGHETDTSLAERVADLRASTPSNAAQLLVPDKSVEIERLIRFTKLATQLVEKTLLDANNQLFDYQKKCYLTIESAIEGKNKELKYISQTIEILNPYTVLRRGYAIVKQRGHVVKSVKELEIKKRFQLQFYDGTLEKN